MGDDGNPYHSHGSIGVQVILLTSQDQVLLQHRDDDPAIAFPGTWALPGGHLDAGESPLSCAIRELAEEMGLELAPSELRLVCAQQRSYGYEHTFWARRDLEVDDVVLTEGQGVALFTHAQVAELDLGYEDGAVLEQFFASLYAGRLCTSPWLS